MFKNILKNVFLKKACAVAFGVALVFSQIESVEAYAETINYLDENGVERSLEEGKYAEITGDTTSLSEGNYAVRDTVHVTGRITVSGAVKLILCDNTVLTASKGINVSNESQSNQLCIYAQSTNNSMGQLIIDEVDSNNAGIGGNDNQSAGTISISGGKITVQGGVNGAGIGGGEGGDGGEITINGGNIEVTSVAYAAGIGGGSNGGGGEITINGGNVTVTGSASGGAGIGSGASVANSGEDGGIITINNGNQPVVIVHNESADGAGIGGGNGTGCGTVTINGGTVEAYGGGGGAGIGGGPGSNQGGEITIIAGDVNVTAVGSAQAAGIGGGYNGNGGIVNIFGGNVTATGGTNGAGIGGGSNGNVGTVNISGGLIKAKSAGGGAAIGNGNGGTASLTGNVNIDPKYGHANLDSGELTLDENAPIVVPTVVPTDDEPIVVNNSTVAESIVDIPAKPRMVLMQSFGGKTLSGIYTIEKQGALCEAAFKAATPKGFTEAFSFNFNLDATGKSKPNYDKKSGKLVLNIPAQYQNPGRTFAIIGIDKNGMTKIFYDKDLDDKTLSAEIDIDGYAFSLIYSDK